jgi:DNA-damage-inducible protein D
MDSNSPLSTSPTIDGNKIRRVWHKDEWWYSVVDIIAQLTDTSNPRQNWSNLKRRIEAEGNRKLASLQLKLPAADGRLRLSDVVNVEQALRVIQSIPSPKAEPMKLWLAETGAERLKEEEDPEEGVIQAFSRAEEKYRRMGRTESWIEARMQGIITRKQFIEALKTAIMDAPFTLYAQATEKVYKGLWDRTTAQLRGDLQLKPQQNVRDHFGEFALIYTGLAERVAAKKLGDAETVPVDVAMNIVWAAAKLISKQAKATSKELGIDLVTERPLLARGK